MLPHRLTTATKKNPKSEQFNRSLMEQKREALKQFAKGEGVTDGRMNGVFVRGDPVTSEAIVRFGVAEKKMSPLALTKL